METIVEHARRPGRPKTRWATAQTSLRRHRSRQLLRSASQGQQQPEASAAPSDAIAGGVRAAVVGMAAAAMAAVVRAGWLGLAVVAARVLLALGLESFAADVVVRLAASGQASSAGALCVAAAERGHQALVRRLSWRLFAGGHAAAASAVAEALWHVADAAGWQPLQTASLLAPAVAAAADSGHVSEVAYSVQLLFNARMQPLLVWLLDAMVSGLGRPDAAAAAAWAALQLPGGAVATSDLSSLLIVDRHFQTAASLAAGLYLDRQEAEGREQVSAVLAAGNAQAIEAGRVAEVAAVCWLLWEQGRLDLLADVTCAMLALPAGRECVGELCWHCMGTGRGQLVQDTSRQILLSGRAADAAAATYALYSVGQPQRVGELAASAICEAVDSQPGAAVATAAAANVLLWRQGAVPLLRDLLVAFAQQGRADVAARASWHALQRGEQEMVAGVSTAVVRSGAAKEAAQLAAGLAEASASDPSVVAALGDAMVAAVRGGSAADAAATAAHLLHEERRGGLLREVTARLLASGHASELASLAAATDSLQGTAASLRDLAEVLSAPAPAPASGGEIGKEGEDVEGAGGPTGGSAASEEGSGRGRVGEAASSVAQLAKAAVEGLAS